MANHQEDSVLVNQVISKLLDSQSIELPNNSALLQLLHPTTQKPPNYTNTLAKTAGQAARQRIELQRKIKPVEKKASDNTSGIILVLIAWVLLVLNILAVMGNLGSKQNIPLSLHAIENTNDFLFQIGLLAVGTLVLCWTTWLYLTNKPNETVAIPVLIIIALALPLALSIKDLDNGTARVRGYSRNLLRTFSSTATPVYRLVTAIIYSEDKPSAVIGNQIVHEGDTLRGINVVKIYKDKVEFEKNGKRWTQAVENNPVNYQ